MNDKRQRPTYYDSHGVRPSYPLEGHISITSASLSASLDAERIFLVAGETIAPSDIVFVKSDNKAYRTTALSVTASFFVGVAVSGAVSGSVFPAEARQGKVLDTFSNLSVGQRYFLSESYGKISNKIPENKGSVVYQVGVAISNSKLLQAAYFLVIK